MLAVREKTFYRYSFIDLAAPGFNATCRNIYELHTSVKKLFRPEGNSLLSTIKLQKPGGIKLVQSKAVAAF